MQKTTIGLCPGQKKMMRPVRVELIWGVGSTCNSTYFSLMKCPFACLGSTLSASRQQNNTQIIAFHLRGYVVPDIVSKVFLYPLIVEAIGVTVSSWNLCHSSRVNHQLIVTILARVDLVSRRARKWVFWSSNWCKPSQRFVCNGEHSLWSTNTIILNGRTNCPTS